MIHTRKRIFLFNLNAIVQLDCISWQIKRHLKPYEHEFTLSLQRPYFFHNFKIYYKTFTGAIKFTQRQKYHFDFLKHDWVCQFNFKQSFQKQKIVDFMF